MSARRDIMFLVLIQPLIEISTKNIMSLLLDSFLLEMSTRRDMSTKRRDVMSTGRNEYRKNIMFLVLIQPLIEMSTGNIMSLLLVLISIRDEYQKKRHNVSGE
jgi:hypothetical protein